MKAKKKFESDAKNMGADGELPDWAKNLLNAGPQKRLKFEARYFDYDKAPKPKRAK